jgi:hypothetical protein
MLRSLTIITLLLPTVALEDEPKPAPIDLTLARRYFAEGQRLAKADDGKLWGKSLAGPMLFVDNRTRFAVASHSDAEGKLKEQAGVFVGLLPQNVGIANTAVQWAGVHWAMIVWPLPDDPRERAVILMHEPFHRVQADLGLPMASPRNAHLDTRDGRYWLQLEWRALAKALATKDDEQRRAVADALLFRYQRRRLIKDAAAEENALEMNEGLAEYTGVKLSGLPEAEQFLLCVKRFEERPTQLKSFVRSFAYLSGPAYGLLLDEFAPDWRTGLKPEDDLGRKLAMALRLSSVEVTPEALNERATQYGSAKLWEAETAREDARQQKLTYFRQLLIDGPVLEIPLVQMQMSFDPNNVVPMEGAGTVYPTLTLRDQWGKLDVKEGALIASDFKRAFVAAPSKMEETVLAGPGWELQLAPGWKAVAGTRKGNWRLERVK